MGILVNSEGPYEMPQNVAFHQSLLCLQRRKNLQGLKNILIEKF